MTNLSVIDRKKNTLLKVNDYTGPIPRKGEFIDKGWCGLARTIKSVEYGFDEIPTDYCHVILRVK